MKTVNELNVLFHNRRVGRIKRYKNYLTAFEYDKDWLLDGFSISPFTLPLKQQVFISKQEPFDGVFGAFSDSLPDGWGRLLKEVSERALEMVGEKKKYNLIFDNCHCFTT
ncbi:MAG: HipA N-terminal domain-containing protein [Phascolarctobacterium sp.]|nr:HipA N-terminal domain-containing protein [Phascolarctobacterium sp.]MBQ9764544.1 HipA N-terminal domain-containing protein [Phascolarctobacterium sp.]